MAGSSRGHQQKEKEKLNKRMTRGQQQKEKEKQQEKGKGKVVRERERELEKEGKKFYIMFLPQQHGERLTIPPLFHQFLGNDPTGVISLKPQSGNTWIVELASDNQGLFFVNGWKEFVADHSLEIGDALTFCYDGHSKFSVVVFDGKCSEKPSAFHAKPGKDLVINIENNEEDKQVNATDCHAKPGKDEAVKQEKDEGEMDKNTTCPPEIDFIRETKESVESSRRRRSKEIDFFF